MLDTEDQQDASPQFKPIRAIQQSSSARLNTSARKKTETSIDSKKKTRAQNPVKFFC